MLSDSFMWILCGALLCSPAFAAEQGQSQTVLALAQAGVTLDTLAASGASASTFVSVITTLEADGEDVTAILSAADAEFAARTEGDAINESIETQGITHAREQARAAAAQALAQATSDMVVARADLIDAAANQYASIDSCANAQTLRQIAANAHRAVPVEYRVLTLTEAQWVDLEQALDAKRNGAEVPEGGPAAVLAAASLNTDVQLARSRHQQNLPLLQQALSAILLSDLSSEP